MGLLNGGIVVDKWWTRTPWREQKMQINISQHTQTVAILPALPLTPDFSKTSLHKLMQIGETILPPELERAVFEDAAFLDYKSIPRLVLVAHRFYIWLEPLLYHVLVCRGGPVSRTIPRRLRDIMNGTSPGSTDFVQRHVRRLAFTRQFLEIPKMLSVCSGATDLAFFTPVEPSFMPHLDRIRPTRLRINISQLFDGSADFSRTMFTNITHLACTDSTIPHDDSWKSLASLQCLTHLSFHRYRYDQYDDNIDFLHAVLTQCRRLHALILFLPPHEFISAVDKYEYQSSDPELPLHDIRFVVTSCARGEARDRWVAGAWECADVWVQADYFIRMKVRDARGDHSDDCFMYYQYDCNWRHFV
ncbi:hypothetical protein C8J57DRAFT_1722552 [Mycena rebaudengoi]|nr:hypothetical protein C8J57DRAFT_1722552 [Mycena rebaudengoi]